MMQSLGRRYVRHFNHVQQRTGTLWEGRYRATLVEAAYRALFAAALEGPEVTAIRDATNKAWALGSERFKEELARLTERRFAPAKPGRPRKQEVTA